MSRNSGKRKSAQAQKRKRRNRGEFGKLPKYKRYSVKVNSEKLKSPFEEEMAKMAKDIGVDLFDGSTVPIFLRKRGR